MQCESEHMEDCVLKVVAVRQLRVARARIYRREVRGHVTVWRQSLVRDPRVEEPGKSTCLVSPDFEQENEPAD